MKCVHYKQGKTTVVTVDLTPVSGEPWEYIAPDGTRYIAISGTDCAVEYPALTRRKFDTSSVDAFFTDIFKRGVYISDTFVRLAALCKPEIVPDLLHRRDEQQAAIAAEQLQAERKREQQLQAERQAERAEENREHAARIANAIAVCRAESGNIDNSSNIVLELADKFGVSVPPRTRALLKSDRLYTVRLDSGEVFVRFQSKANRVPDSVYDAIDKIVFAVKNLAHGR